MRSSEYKAGYSKEDIPRSYKYKRGGIYGIMYEVEQELEQAKKVAQNLQDELFCLKVECNQLKDKLKLKC